MKSFKETNVKTSSAKTHPNEFDLNNEEINIKCSIDKMSEETNSKPSAAFSQPNEFDLNNEENSKLITHNKEHEYIEITDTMLGFEEKTRKPEWVTGVYVQEILLNKLLMHVDDIYAFKVSYLISLMNRELMLRNITLEEKIHEKEKELEELEILHEKSGRSENHDHPGCIILRLTRKPDEYKIDFDIKERKIPEYNTLHFNNVYNPSSTCSKLKFYARKNIWDDVKYVSNGKYQNSTLWIKSMKAFVNAINDVQKFNIEIPPIETLISNVKEGYKSRCHDLKADMFEIYCSIKSGIKLFKYETGERLSLKKNDNGLDLLDIDNEIMGQCKYYVGDTAVCIGKTKQFLQFCKDYPEYKHKLFISTLSKINKNVEEIPDVEIIRINDEEFTDWYMQNTNGLDPYKAVKRFGNFTREEYEDVETWLKDLLDNNEYVLRSYAIDEINQRFAIKISSGILFGQLFSHLYQQFRKQIPKDGDGNEILVANDKEIPVFEDKKKKKEDEEFVKLIGNGQFTYEDIKDEVFKIIGKEVSATLIGNRFKHLLVTVANNTSNRFPTRLISGKRTQIYELNINQYPNKLKEFKTFIDQNKSIQKKQDLIQCFNDNFHRYETATTFYKLLSSIND